MLMASADVFVSPSETETFGNTVVEAQASGTPVVVADRGAARENMVDGITGLVVNGRSAEEIGAAVRWLLGEPRMRARMAAAAAGFVARYDMKTAAEATFGEYGRFLSALGRAASAGARPVTAPTPERPVAYGRPAFGGGAAGASASAATAIVSEGEPGEWRP